MSTEGNYNKIFAENLILFLMQNKFPPMQRKEANYSIRTQLNSDF